MKNPSIHGVLVGFSWFSHGFSSFTALLFVFKCSCLAVGLHLSKSPSSPPGYEAMGQDLSILSSNFHLEHPKKHLQNLQTIANIFYHFLLVHVLGMDLLQTSNESPRETLLFPPFNTSDTQRGPVWEHKPFGQWQQKARIVAPIKRNQIFSTCNQSNKMPPMSLQYYQMLPDFHNLSPLPSVCCRQKAFNFLAEVTNHKRHLGTGRL